MSNTNETTIKSVKIEGKGRAEVTATLSDGTEKHLFGYYTDELSFSADEFVGMTVQEAQDHRTRRDIAYLQS